MLSSPPQGAIAASSPSLITTCRENLIIWIEVMVLLFSPPTNCFNDGDNNKDVAAVVVTHPLSEFSQGGQNTAHILIRVLDSVAGGF